MDQVIRRCSRCEKWRHVSQFRRYALWCADCEMEEAFDQEGRDWESEQTELARFVLHKWLNQPKQFDMGDAYQAAERVKIGNEVATILAGKRPAIIPRKAWRLVKLRNEGHTLPQSASLCKLDTKRALDLERETMTELVARARMNIKRRDDEQLQGVVGNGSNGDEGGPSSLLPERL